MQKYVKAIGDERLTKVPVDLDLKPYRDYHDYELLRQMEKHIERIAGASTKQKTELKSYADAFREELRVQQRHALHAPESTDKHRKPAAKKSTGPKAKPAKTTKAAKRRTTVKKAK
jgi:hypothetical protein